MDKVFVGKIVNTHGIKGEFRIKSDFELKDRVFVVGNLIIIDGNTYEIMSYRVHKGYDMITIKGFSNINDVLPFKGKNVYINRDTLKLSDNEFILDDLIDVSVICNGETLGTVSDYTNGENPLLVVKAKKDFYIPLKGNFIIKFDASTRSLYVSSSTKELMIWR